MAFDAVHSMVASVVNYYSLARSHYNKRIAWLAVAVDCRVFENFAFSLLFVIYRISKYLLCFLSCVNIRFGNFVRNRANKYFNFIHFFHNGHCVHEYDIQESK